ncbi:hypothetical protein SPRG_07392 [Saprolegnia parasitica CBS 223.65]|uniref:Uncharacterized protein n=1 Tax=Saprolegnia parasitica (strain CBS 223.65) TaxID=695850 RepID=A0A067CBD7_SAPPC|nr:hypothetical protein SPRG_07392 [Saprolegnia parasitica CBS 223.65]KDO27793.1 hypothetical protein SPRG_07392 [Saprolegnia parasitica CBS 223.65]|eukprot:XP_012201568.1 hypothetical protein SPRG_07392 [Saprolegnia parasitica CBS 223.65]
MGNSVCGCGRVPPPSDDVMDALFAPSPRKEYVPPSTSTMTRTLLKPTKSPASAKGNDTAPVKPKVSTKLVEVKEEEAPVPRQHAVSDPTPTHQHHPPHQHQHHHHAPPPTPKEDLGKALAISLMDEEAASSTSLERDGSATSRDDSSTSLESTASTASLGSPRAASSPDNSTHGSSHKSSKKKAKYGRANYRAGSSKGHRHHAST